MKMDKSDERGRNEVRSPIIRAPEEREERMEKGANETTPPDVAGAAKTKREKRAASHEKGGFCKNRVELVSVVVKHVNVSTRRFSLARSRAVDRGRCELFSSTRTW